MVSLFLIPSPSCDPGPLNIVLVDCLNFLVPSGGTDNRLHSLVVQNTNTSQTVVNDIRFGVPTGETPYVRTSPITGVS